MCDSRRPLNGADSAAPETSDRPLQAGDPCPFRSWSGERQCPGQLGERTRTEWIGPFSNRRKVTRRRLSCTAGHRVCEAPGCRNEAPRRARYCSDRCRLRAWRGRQRADRAALEAPDPFYPDDTRW